MKHFSKSELAEIRKIDLLTYFMNTAPDELIPNGRRDYVTKTHSSLHISNGMWMWWAQKIGGRSALDYLIKVENMEFLDAADQIYSLSKKGIVTQEVRKQKRVFILPERARSNELAFNYLVGKRKLDPKIIFELMDLDLIYESDKHDVVFVGKDENDTPRFGCTRSIFEKDKKDISGSDKQYSFYHKNEGSDDLYVFESCIDMISFMTIQKCNGKDPFQDNYVSLDGVSTIALSGFLNRNKYIKRLNLCLDQDEAGQAASKEIVAMYDVNYQIRLLTFVQAKDVNELLVKNGGNISEEKLHWKGTEYERGNKKNKGDVSTRNKGRMHQYER